MKFVGLVLKSARRSKRRTALTILSVAIAVFLFASLRNETFKPALDLAIR